MNGGGSEEAAEAVTAAAAPVGAPLQLEWKFAQVFGERTAGEEVQEGTIRSVVRVCDFVLLDYLLLILV
jgi:serine/threonine-protein phosphatase 2A regulatory subunit B